MSQKIFKIVARHTLDTDICHDDNVSIVESVLFKFALIKLQLNSLIDVSSEERKPIDCLRKSTEFVDSLDTSHNKDLIEIAMHDFKEEMCITHN